MENFKNLIRIIQSAARELALRPAGNHHLLGRERCPLARKGKITY